MNKIRNKNKIYQFSLNKELINEFENSQEAEKQLCIPKDSILKGCNGKLKTVKGFIFSFNNKLEEQKTELKCEICNSNETIRSMAMHLKFFHNITTKEYIKNYNEFRPKFIELNNKKEKSGLKCEICNQKMLNNRQLMFHIPQHNILQKDYIIKYYYNGISPKCKCGCNGEVEILINGKNCDLNKETYSRDYIKGHWDWNITSNEENELIEYIKSIYSGEIILNSRNIISPQELDIYLPNLNIAIEYNGLYWHSEKVGKNKNYHLNKTLLAQTKGIRLIHIFSDEWNNKKDIVKIKLNNILKLNLQNKIYARKCEIKEVSISDKNEFLNKFHIQGADRSEIKLGLYYNNELVACMTFSKPRLAIGKTKTNKISYELSRYATSYNITGGASKLLKYFIKNYKPELIYSYSDNRWSDPNNNMYLNIGFTKKQTSLPGYYYTKDFIKRLHRFNFNKTKLKQQGYDTLNKTEFKIMDELGYNRIWDCGTTKFELYLENT